MLLKFDSALYLYEDTYIVNPSWRATSSICEHCLLLLSMSYLLSYKLLYNITITPMAGVSLNVYYLIVRA